MQQTKQASVAKWLENSQSLNKKTKKRIKEIIAKHSQEELSQTSNEFQISKSVAQNPPDCKVQSTGVWEPDKLENWSSSGSLVHSVVPTSNLQDEIKEKMANSKRGKMIQYDNGSQLSQIN